MVIAKVKLQLPLLLLLFLSTLFLAASVPFRVGDACVDRYCGHLHGHDRARCVSKYCLRWPPSQNPVSEQLAQCQQRCGERRLEPQKQQQCQSMCLLQHQQHQQCMQRCQGQGITTSQSPQVCQRICEGEGREYYLVLWHSTPRGKLYFKCMESCQRSQEPQLCQRTCKQKYREEKQEKGQKSDNESQGMKNPNYFSKLIYRFQ